MDNLKIGDCVKIIIYPDKIEKEYTSPERIWVIVERLNGNNITGIVDNDPFVIKSVKYKDKLKFVKSDIIDIIKKEDLIDFTSKDHFPLEIQTIPKSLCLYHTEISKTGNEKMIFIESDDEYKTFYPKEQIWVIEIGNRIYECLNSPILIKNIAKGTIIKYKSDNEFEIKKSKFSKAVFTIESKENVDRTLKMFIDIGCKIVVLGDAINIYTAEFDGKNYNELDVLTRMLDGKGLIRLNYIC